VDICFPPPICHHGMVLSFSFTLKDIVCQSLLIRVQRFLTFFFCQCTPLCWRYLPPSLLLLFVLVVKGADNVTMDLLPLKGSLSSFQMIHEWIWSSGGMILTGENWRTWRKTFPSATLSTTNPTWTVLGVNPGLQCEKPATYGMTPTLPILRCFVN
jgi:hypothetical protein